MNVGDSFSFSQCCTLVDTCSMDLIEFHGSYKYMEEHDSILIWRLLSAHKATLQNIKLAMYDNMINTPSLMDLTDCLLTWPKLNKLRTPLLQCKESGMGYVSIIEYERNDRINLKSVRILSPNLLNQHEFLHFFQTVGNFTSIYVDFGCLSLITTVAQHNPNLTQFRMGDLVGLPYEKNQIVAVPELITLITSCPQLNEIGLYLSGVRYNSSENFSCFHESLQVAKLFSVLKNRLPEVRVSVNDRPLKRHKNELE